MTYREKAARGIVRITGAAPLLLTDVLKAVYPVGAYYMSDSPTNPATVFGFGTWTQVKGRMLIGVDSADADWDTPGDVGGEKTHVLTPTEMPNHDHGPGSLAATVTGSSHTHGIQRGTSTGSAPARAASGNTTAAADFNTDNAGSGHTHTISGLTGTRGSDNAHNNMPPFIATYMWRRTA